jgi:predicted DNA-binding protein YlxM (UPF0122 family)
MSPGIDSVLKEICQKLSNVETKLTKLDKIEERLEIMDKKFKTVDTGIILLISHIWCTCHLCVL